MGQWHGYRRIGLDEFVRMDADSALRFDFGTQGPEADNTPLAREIYQKLFRWYDPERDSGDTFNTYRTAVMRRFYKKSYGRLDRQTQLSIVQTIAAFTKPTADQHYEFDVTDEDGNSVKQLRNNYRLGNLGIFPRGRINPTRAQSPYDDFFDQFLVLAEKFYSGQLEPVGALQKAILAERDYFDQFGGPDQFVVDNYLEDFYDQNGVLIPLSKCESLAEYADLANRIIQCRGARMLAALRA
jgi:hypothetical protein